jgi:hypothetical protein
VQRQRSSVVVELRLPRNGENDARRGVGELFQAARAWRPDTLAERQRDRNNPNPVRRAKSSAEWLARKDQYAGVESQASIKDFDPDAMRFLRDTVAGLL